VKPFLATGHGRSGTLWTAQFFSGIGVPTEHEEQFNATSPGQLDVSEVSWLAVPYLTSLPPKTRVLRVVRDPYASVISGMQMDFQRRKQGTVFDRFLARHRPDIVEADDKLTRIIRWVALWDAPIDNYAHRVIRPDIDRIDQLGEAVEYATGLAPMAGRIARVCHQLGNTVNTKQRSVEITRNDIDNHPEGWRIKRRSERFGYA
jgi:hypothetical protein